MTAAGVAAPETEAAGRSIPVARPMGTIRGRGARTEGMRPPLKRLRRRRPKAINCVALRNYL